MTPRREGLLDRASRLLFLFMLGLAACGRQSPPQPPAWRDIQGVNAAYQVVPRGESRQSRAQAMLLHDTTRGPEVWQGLVQQLSSAGYEVLLVQLREAPSEALVQRLTSLFSEAATGLNALLGEGDGALLALQVAAAEPGIGAVVMLSPPLQAHGADGPAIMREFSECPVLLVASEDDLNAATSVLQYKDAAPAFCEVQLYPGNAHGADIFALKPNAMLAVGDWMRLILDKPPIDSAQAAN